MLFTATQRIGLEIGIHVGNFGTAAFWLSHYASGITDIGQQPDPPYQSAATFRVDPAQLAGWGWNNQGFAVRVAMMSPSSAAFPIALVVGQNAQPLQALDVRGSPINGAAAPFGPILLGSLTGGRVNDFAFSVHFR